jgi:hypothetical protein
MAFGDASTTNTLTNLIPTLYLALDTVSRELCGFIPAVTRDSSFARAAIGQTVRSFVAPAATASTIAPATVPIDDGQQTIGNISLSIDNARRVPIRWQGEESLQMNGPGGIGVSRIMVDQFAQAMRTLVNEIETDLGELYIYASRGAVPHASTLFSDGLDDAANVRKILADNGAPMSDLQLVIDTSAGAALRSLTQLNKANEAGGDSLLRQGVLLDIHGMAVRESAQVVTPASVGTEADATLHATTDYAKGDTVMELAAAGTGTVLEGDLVTIAATGQTTVQYVNAAAIDAVSGHAFTIRAPGLVRAITDNGCAIAVRPVGSRCMAFSRSAIVLATRMPALPEGGDLAVDRTIITDPRSGLSFEVSKYLMYRQVQYEVAIAWGCKAVKSEHIAILAGA